MEKLVTITNASGLHARPAGMFVKKAAEFKSTVEVNAKGKTVNAKSIMGIMSLGLAQGDELTIVANGEDQEAAVNALAELIESGFGE
ncbi:MULTISPECIES: HPr family phosphocarrier protein [Romboutsia]|uniref:Phosphocarrier protein signature n=1 Tax=Romboutsia hominis TaxID=1507512 RepID=A0A2P2BU01_9FIRM|nr:MULTISPECIES: HPr family phosphocarrier protein [Romboutsia]MCH1961117.1 HPr family phosphocarrier protein [Romboutsia hominis]MCH1968458.1 HPr family phosphocarrier protein [Romboutsia hominis]MDB8789381.1 HPr family phosphocarrier protein [Romboutsia sp. 1001216sp1]MDB8792764.1 HPr family phosphocarrier protein [Romboutsia sp. 1001216sp1]MDB8795434.1 HPr family phosphocarrier protein [Romboutsia sp. 1001216sp1]